MAVPKRRHSISRRGKRRSHHALKAPTLGVCDHCGQPKLSHRACPNCGYYRGRQVIFPREV
ncbi:MAG: 50S ribosomal protein L32 [Candidatus Latescibacteria bacterium]|nr:50S ribosomal protein L32 [Candidatus Latescibacterota bacterium]